MFDIRKSFIWPKTIKKRYYFLVYFLAVMVFAGVLNSLNYKNEKECFQLFTSQFTTKKAMDIEFNYEDTLVNSMQNFLDNLDKEEIEESIYSQKCFKQHVQNNDYYEYYYECRPFFCQHRHTVIGFLFPNTPGLGEGIEYVIYVKYNKDDEIVEIEFKDYW
ncbi:MAG TPA: hypothetical protein PLN69_08280 [bacterium]|nr:hypothetical protein [bacterium]